MKFLATTTTALSVMALTSILLLLNGCGGGSSNKVSSTSSETVSSTSGDTVTQPASLDATETSHLIFMREEEKLARDVYLKLADMYPEQGVFAKIATTSEQTHTDTMRDKLAQFGIPDPNPATNELPTSIGIFTGTEWGWYFTQKFSELVAKASNSELDALYVGALIEELDMNDIANCPAVMVKAGYPEPCGMNYTDEPVLQRSYASLIDGSENHLRAYVGQIEAVIGVGNYKAQYLSQEEVDAILGR